MSEQHLHSALASTETQDDHDVASVTSLEEQQQALHRSRNIPLIYVLAFLGRLMWSCSFGPWIDIYMSDLSGNRNRVVGLVESARGTVLICVSLCSGMVADKVSRAAMLRTSAVLMVPPSVLYGWGVYQENLALVAVALLMHSFTGQFGLMAQELLLQDCSTDFDRTLILSKKNALENFALGLGPLLQMVMVLMRGRRQEGGADWSVGLIKEVLLFGLLIQPVLVMLTFLVHHVKPGAGNAAQNRSAGTEPWRAQLIFGCARRDVLVTIWAEACWILSNAGAGLTLKFVPLFWREVVRLSPIGLLIVQVAEPWGLALCNNYTPQITQRLGRAQSCVVFVFLGAIFLAIFACFAGRDWLPTPMAALIWVLRTSTGRAWVPCISSILYTCVPPEKQGRYTSVSTIKSYCFSVFSGIGGEISDNFGFRASFLITAAVQAVVAFSFLPVISWFRPAEAAIAHARSCADAEN